jgi:hypothetical protein
MISVSMTNVLASMPPTGGAEAYIGSNAYSIAFPTKDEPPVVVDGQRVWHLGVKYFCVRRKVKICQTVAMLMVYR